MKREVVRKLPKVELHCHLDGSIRPETLLKIAQQQGIALPTDVEELKELLVAPASCSDLNDYLQRFDVVNQCLQTTEALTEAAFDVVSQAAAENIQYIEVRFAPTLHTAQGLTLFEVIEAVLKGLQQGQAAFGMQANALLCGMRHEELAVIETVVAAAEQFKTTGVVGFDLAGNEIDYPPLTFEKILKTVTESAIPLTLHAGECGCGKNVADAVYLGATRIGHGIAVKDTPEYFALLREQNILLEMCPTSNFQTKTVTCLADYPLPKLLAENIKVCINTDNRTVSNTTLTDEYMKLHQWYQLTYQEMAQLNHNAVDGAFISAQSKAALHAHLTQAYQDL